MASEIPNATEVASEKVEVPPDPGCYIVRSCYRGEWIVDHTEDTEEAAISRAKDILSHFDKEETIATRIFRIPPQGEQVADDGMVRVDRETLAEMYEHFTMRTDEDAIVFGATLKLILGDHHKKGGA